MRLKNKTFKMSVLMVTMMIISNSIFSQMGSPRGNNQEKREKIKIQKIAFITDNLDLTVEEAEKFWPVYNANENTMNEMRESFKTMFKEKAEDIEGLSNEESKELINAKLEHEQKMLDQRKLFHQDLDKVLPEKKILLLMEAEREFKVALMRNLSEPRGNKSGSRGDGRR